MRVSVSIPDELYEAVEIRRKKLGTGRSEFYVMAVRAYIKHLEDEEAAKAGMSATATKLIEEE